MQASEKEKSMIGENFHRFAALSNFPRRSAAVTAFYVFCLLSLSPRLLFGHILGCFDCPESRKLFNAGNEMHSALLNSKQAMMKLTEWSDENNYDVIIIAYFSLPA